jgi:hypothetical protein
MRREGLNDDKERTYVSGNGGRLVFVRCFSSEAGVGAARTFMILCFCDGEDYTGWRKKSLNKNGNTLNTVCQMPLRHFLYALAYDVAPFDGYSSDVSSDILLPFQRGRRHFPHPITLLGKSIPTYQTKWYLTTEYSTMTAKSVSLIFISMPPYVPYGFRGLPSRLWPKCNRLLRLGRP